MRRARALEMRRARALGSELWGDRRGVIYLFSVILIAAMLVILVGSLVILEKTTSGTILSREEELSYFQLECVKAFENKIASVISLDTSGKTLQAELDKTISMLREQAEERGMSQKITYEVDFEPSSLDLSPRKVSFDVTTKSQGETSYDRREFILNDVFVYDGYLFVGNRRMDLRFKILPGSDEVEGDVDGSAVYLGSDVVLATSVLTDYLNASSWTNATSVYHYTVEEQPGLVTIHFRNETTKLALSRYLYVKLDEVQWQVSVEPKVVMEKSISYGVGFTPNINEPSNDMFRIDNLTGGQLNPSASWSDLVAKNATFKVRRPNSWVVVYDDDPQPYAFGLILDEAETISLSSTRYDEGLICTPGRRGRFIVNGILRAYPSYEDAVADMRELKKLGKPPLGRVNYLEPLVMALSVDELTFDPPAPKAGMRVGMIATIKNYGTKDAFDAVVHFYDGPPLPDRSNLLGITNISSIINGHSEPATMTWTFSQPAVHEIYVVLDPDFLLGEDPTDNVKHVPLKIYPQDEPIHDIAVEAVHVGKNAPAVGDVVSVSALIHNNGNRDQKDVVARLQVISSANVTRNITQVIIPVIPLNYYVSAPISFIYQAGDERVRVCTDPVFNETDLTNNAKEAYISSSGILIVADDNLGPADGLHGTTSLSEFLSALDDPKKYNVVVWSEQERGDPTSDILLFFDAVAWTCGDYDGHDVETSDARTLVDYINAGGHLVIEGEDIAYRHHQNPSSSPDNFLWNVTKTYIDGYFDPDLGRTVPVDDVEFDGDAQNLVPQINTYPTHPVMTNLPISLGSNYTARYPDAILPMGSVQLGIYESPDPNFLVLEDDLRSGLFNWASASSLVSSPVLSGTAAFKSTGNNNFAYTFPYTVGDRIDQYRFIDLWLYFSNSFADILLQIDDNDGSWGHRWGWDAQSSYDGYNWLPRQGQTLNCPVGSWIHYRLDLVTDLGLAPGTKIEALAFSSNNADVYYDHVRLARKDSWKSSMVAYENATSGSKMAFFAYPVTVVENRTRKILIRNAIDWVAGRTLNRAPLITVTSPSGAEKWKGQKNITWSASDPDGDVLWVDLCYSQNGGLTWVPLTYGLPGVGYWTWDTTTVPDGYYLVKAIADDSMLRSEDPSPNFEIDNINDPPTITVTRPNTKMRLSGTESILWSASDPDGDALTYDIEWWNGSTWFTITTSYIPPVPASPSYDWNTYTVPDGINYTIRIKATDGKNVAQDMSDKPFSVENNNQDPTVQVTSPNGGEWWSGTKTITWAMNDLDGAPQPIGDPFRDRVTATVDYDSIDAIFTGSYSPDVNGFLRDWLLVGAYSGSNLDTDYLGGEAVALPWAGRKDNGLAWWKNRGASNKTDLYVLMNPKSTVTGYALAYIYNPVDRDALMKVGHDDGMEVYLNGILVHRSTLSALSADRETVPVHLGQGWNVVLVKVVQGSGSWGFYFRFTDLADQPITDLMISLDRPNNYDTGYADATGARLGSVVDLTSMVWGTKTVPNGNYTVKVTVDDARGGIVSDTSDSTFVIRNNRDPIVKVIYPNGDEILFGNVTIVWNATDPDGDVMTFKLWYNRGGGSWQLIDTITNSTWRWYLWDISGLPDSPPEYYVKVEAYDTQGGVGWDVSDDGTYIGNANGTFGSGGPGNFTGYRAPTGQIGGPGTPPGWGGGGGGGGGGGAENDPADRLSMVMLLSPVGGENWDPAGTRGISWVAAYFGAGLKFDVDVSKDSGSAWTRLATGITSTSYTWDTKNFPDRGDSNRYKVRVTGYDDEGNVDTDQSMDFTVYNNVEIPLVTVTAPKGGDWWSGIRTITWSANDPDGDGDNNPTTPYGLTFDVYYSDNSGSTWTQLAYDITANRFDWDTTTVGDDDDYRVKVVAKEGNIKNRLVEGKCAVFHIDNANEAPDEPTISSPKKDDKLKDTIQIAWTASDPDNDPLSFSLFYSSDAGTTWNSIVTGLTPVAPYTYNWDSTKVPDGTQYMVQVVAVDDGGLQSVPAVCGYFTIDNTDPLVSITSPAYPPAPVVSKTITIKGTASDVGGSELEPVEIWLRGIRAGPATMVGGDAWEYTVDTTTLPEDQTVTVQAIAYDGSGNTATSSIQVKIDNVGN